MKISFLFYVLCSRFSTGKLLFDVTEDTRPDELMYNNQLPDNGKNVGKCLDGSQPGYFFRPGYGNGKNKYLFMMQGGGWCGMMNNPDQSPGREIDAKYCTDSIFTGRGTTQFDSDLMSLPPKGILSGNKTENPEFYDWNMVLFRYCDGSSFSGMNMEPYIVDTPAGKQKIYTRGYYNLIELIALLQQNEPKIMKADNIVLTGCSAVGHAVLLRCDDVASKFEGVPFKCVVDSGYFADITNFFSRENRMRERYQNITDMHDVKPHTECAKVKKDMKYDYLACTKAEYAAKHTKTDILLVQSSLDKYSMFKIWFGPQVEMPEVWEACCNDISLCSSTQRRVLRMYNMEMRERLQSYLSDADGVRIKNHNLIMTNWPKHGMYKYWTDVNVRGTTIRDAVNNFNRGEKFVISDKEIDVDNDNSWDNWLTKPIQLKKKK